MDSKRVKVMKCLFLGLLWIKSLFCFAHSDTAFSNLFNLAQENKNAWSISGLLHNEQDDYYGFMFIVEKDHQLYHAYAGIFNLNDQSVVWHHEEMRSIEDLAVPENIGRFFWHYSPVNNSLIIGCQDSDDKKQIINLKIDLIEPTLISQKVALTPSLKMTQYWSGSINGHIHLSQEQFVTSSSAWIQNIWQNADDLNFHPFSQILCKFQDGSSMYAIQVPEEKALKASLAGLYNNDGQSLPISQFIDLKQHHGSEFQLSLYENKISLKLNTLFENHHYQALLANMNQGDQTGFCLYQDKPWQIFTANEISFTPIAKPASHLKFLEKTIALVKKPYKIPFNLKNKESS